MQFSSESVESLVEHFCRLPTIGRKTARRLVSYILKMPRDQVASLAVALLAVKDNIKNCTVCQNITDSVPCPICRSEKRDHATICVVEDSNDVAAMERTREYQGVYHVLGGVISPLDGVGPEDLRIRELVQRIAPEGKLALKEVILAVNPTIEGDTTAHYIGQLLAPFGVTVTRLASGLPIGSDLKYTDEATLARALAGRSSL